MGSFPSLLRWQSPSPQIGTLMDYYLGIDIGTSKIKSVLFDAQFNQCQVASADNLTEVPFPGHAEQDMEQLWRNVVTTLRALADSPLLQQGRILAIGLSGQGEGAWLVDAAGQPVRKAILWSDTRSAPLVARLKQRPEREERLFRQTGTRLLPCNSSLILKWLAENQPDALSRTRYFFFAKDWIRYRLTGAANLELTDTGTSLLDLHSETLSDEVLTDLGLQDIRPLFPPLLRPGQRAGEITVQAAAVTGLAAGIPVCAGALDVSAAALGIGAVHHDDVYTLLGTTCCTGIVCDSLAQVSPKTRFVAHAQQGRYINLFAMQAGTPNLDWAVRELGGDGDLERIGEQIAAIPAGSGGVLYQPYLNGERAPFYSQAARAGFFGIGQHTGNLHLLRAVFEGLAFAIKDSLHDYPPQGDLYLAGGGAASAIWLQIIADCTGRRVITSRVKELSARGVAILAAQSIGVTVSHETLVQAESRRLFIPDPTNQQVYQALYPLFRQLRLQLEPLWQSREQILNALNAGTPAP